MSEWKRYKLGELLSIKHGWAFKSENYVKDGKTALVTLRNISEDSSFVFDVNKTTYYGGEYPEEYNLNEGDLIIPLTEQVVGLLGNSAFVPNFGDIKFVLNQRVGKVQEKYEKIDKIFLKYLLSTTTVRTQMEYRASGTKQRNISPKDIYDIEVYIPELVIQKYIGRILYNLDKKIQINNQINQELEAMAKTLYDYWFVQFDFPDQNGKPYKSSGGKMVYNPELKREIPEGWGVESLVDNTLSTVIKPGIDEFTQKTYLATADVVNTSIKGGRLITYDNRETRANMQPSVNSVWFAKMKSSNKHLFLSHSMKELIDSTILSTGFMGLQCKEESFEYLASFISDPDFEIFKDKLSHGATQQAVNVNDLKSILVTIPDDYTLHEFHKKVKSIFLNIGRNTVEDKYLNSLRDWLLPMLMNGQVKVE